MFLKKALLAIIVGTSLSAEAKPLSLLESGDYKLISGDKNLCSDFSIDSNDLKAKTLSISASYPFETTNSKHTEESEFDDACVFKEENIREDDNTKIKLVRINEEICTRKQSKKTAIVTIESKTISTAIIKPGEIVLIHKVDDAEPYTCVFKK